MMDSLARLFAICTFLIMSFHTHANISKVTFKDKLNNQIKEEIADLDVGFDVDYLDLDLAEGLGISSRYRYEVEPSYQAGYFSRYDRWKINAELKQGDIIKGESNLPLYFKINRSSEVLFLRQFKSQRSALSARPYTVDRLPLNAKKALKLATGDFVSIPAQLSVSLGLSSTITKGFASANGNLYVIYSGDFLIHIFKMDNNKVRLRLISQRSRAHGLETKLSVEPQIFGISILDDGIDNIVDLNSSFSYTKSSNDQLIVDYIFDLSRPEAASAYNNILSSTHKLKGLEFFSAMIKGQRIEHSVVSVYEQADALAMEDVGKKNKRVERIFKGFNRFKSKVSKLKIGVGFASYKNNWNRTRSNISYEDKLGQRHHFYYPSFTYHKKNEVDFLVFRSEERLLTSYFGLLPVQEDGQSRTYTDLGYIYDRKDRRFSSAEQKRFRQKILDMLPNSITDKIDWGSWNSFNKKRAAVAFFQLVFKKEAYRYLQGLDRDTIYKLFLEHYTQRELIDLNYFDRFLTGMWRGVSFAKAKHKVVIRSISKKLERIFNDHEQSSKEKLDMFLDLREKSIFKKVGYSFLISLLPKDKLDELVYVDLNVHAKDETKVEFKFGDTPYSKIYEQIIYINKVLNDRSYDLRVSEDLDILDEPI